MPAPAELVSVERMIFHFVKYIVANHGFHRDKLGGGLQNLCVTSKFERLIRAYLRHPRLNSFFVVHHTWPASPGVSWVADS
jgi:hypothetical protein